MSTYIDIAINPKTSQHQKALFIDDYYGSRRYGVGFRNDGKEPSLSDVIITSDYIIYPLEEVKLPLSNTDGDLTINDLGASIK